MATWQAVPLGLEPSFGFGDRTGLATPGHLAALLKHGGPIQPIFPQQSIREMKRTNRNPELVMKAAVDALKAANYTGKFGADADHLKTEADVDVTANAGFVFFTIDPSDYVDFKADKYDIDVLAEKFTAIKHEVRWLDRYHDKTIDIPGGPKIHFDQATLMRAAVKYGKAIDHAIKIANHIDTVMTRLGRAYEIELSVDETPEPTTLAEHYIIAEQCKLANMKLVSLAPRYIGEFEKGIDYKGIISELEKSLRDHMAIAKKLGPYKLSLHSGSDKLSIYGLFARVTEGMFHVKTAGTSYLEAVRVIARHDGHLFRQIVDFSRNRFDTDKATYHISAELSNAASPGQVADDRKLEAIYLDENDGRQILHVTFGSVLTDAVLGPAFHECLKANPDTHREILLGHFGKHLDALRRG